MLRYDRQTKPGLVALYDIRPGNGVGLVLQPRSPHGAKRCASSSQIITTNKSTPRFLQAVCPFCTQPTVSEHWREYFSKTGRKFYAPIWRMYSLSRYRCSEVTTASPNHQKNHWALLEQDYFKGPCTSINKSHQTISKTPRDIGRTDRILIARTGPLSQFTQRRFKPSNQVVATINSHVIVSSFYFQFLLKPAKFSGRSLQLTLLVLSQY